jgi:hypothetical protein
MRSKVAIYQKISDHESDDQAQRENNKDYSHSGGRSFHASVSEGSAGKTRCVSRHETSNDKRSERQKHSNPYFHAALSAPPLLVGFPEGNQVLSSPLLTRAAENHSCPLLHGDGLGKIPRLIYVASAAHRDVIGQQLQRNDFQYR